MKMQEKVKMQEKRSVMPSIGFGTMEYLDGTHEPSEMEDVVARAVKEGYRFFDCAEMYATTAAVGRGLEKSIQAGHARRDEIFVATKLKGIPCGDYEAVSERLRVHLKDLR